MTDADRIDTFINTLREANSTESSGNYNTQSPAGKLITLIENTYNLAWSLALTIKQNANYVATVTAGSIKRNATNIINICITELENLGLTTESAIKLIATDGALWFWSLNLPPLTTLDQYTPPTERIQSLHVAIGNLAEWWPIDISPENPIEPTDKLEQVFVNLAYEATCAIIAHTN